MSDAVQKVDTYLAGLPAWQRTNLQIFREFIHDSHSGISEEWKWNVPVFMLAGKTLFAMSAFKAHTKYNFILNGALLSDTTKLFNNGFESNKSRAIDLREGEKVDSDNLQALITQAITKAEL